MYTLIRIFEDAASSAQLLCSDNAHRLTRLCMATHETFSNCFSVHNCNGASCCSCDPLF